MKSQKHNVGELADLKVSIEKDVYQGFLKMVENTGITLDELVCIAMKRFRSSHCDYEENHPFSNESV